MEEEIRIPKERIAVLIGEKGATKKYIQKKTGTKISVNSEEGNIKITSEDSFNVFLTLQIIKAIGRGFNPDIALILLKEDTQLEIINIKDLLGPSKKTQERVKARIIGTKGKARRTLEGLTNTHISIYGKTVSIIGSVDDVFLAKRSVERLLLGSPHGNVYKWLEKQKSIKKEN